MAYSGATKILKQGGEPLDKFEESVNTVKCFSHAALCIVTHDIIRLQALLEVESNADIRASLREVFFTGAKEIDAAGKKAICVQVPVPQQKTFQKIQVS